MKKHSHILNQSVAHIDQSVFNTAPEQKKNPLIQDLLKSFSLLQATPKSTDTTTDETGFKSEYMGSNCKTQDEILIDTKLAFSGYIPLTEMPGRNPENNGFKLFEFL